MSLFDKVEARLADEAAKAEAGFLTGEAREQEKRAIRAEAQAALFRSCLDSLINLLEAGLPNFDQTMIRARDRSKKALFENPVR